MSAIARKFAGSSAMCVLVWLGFAQPVLGANDCPAILPAGAGALGELRLCQVGATGVHGFSVCREYSDDQRLYQVMFQGGTSPAVVLVRPVAGAGTVNDQSPENNISVSGAACDLARPEGVPVASVYRGTGVCRDEQGEPLPCSVYEHAAAREPVAIRYFVYYEPDGTGLRKVDALPAGRNERVLEAEIAFQLGQAMAGAACCREDARGYLAHAVTLFPRDSVYLTAFQKILAPGTTTASAQTTHDCGPDNGAMLSSSY